MWQDAFLGHAKILLCVCVNHAVILLRAVSKSRRSADMLKPVLLYLFAGLATTFVCAAGDGKLSRLPWPLIMHALLRARVVLPM